MCCKLAQLAAQASPALCVSMPYARPVQCSFRHTADHRCTCIHAAQSILSATWSTSTIMYELSKCCSMVCLRRSGESYTLTSHNPEWGLNSSVPMPQSMLFKMTDHMFIAKHIGVTL